MPYIIFYYIIICYLFSEATTTVLKSFTNSTGKHLCWSLFLKKLQACRPISCSFFSIPNDHVNYVKSYCLYKHFYGFPKIEIVEKKKHSFHNKHIYKRVTDILKFYEVLFCTICKVFFCLLKTVIMLNSPYMHKTLLTLGNEK